MTIYGDSSNWEVVQSKIDPSVETDLVYVLVHEFGHWIGLEHAPNTAMRAASYEGTARARALVTGDIEAIRSAYGTADAKYYWKEFDGSSFGSGHALPPTSFWQRADADIGGKAGSSDFFVGVSGVNMDGTSLKFQYASYPLNSPTWFSTWRAANTWQTPGIASNGRKGSDAVWVAAWFTKPTFGSSGDKMQGWLKIIVADNPFFSNAVTWSYPDVSAYKPAVAYDPVEKYFYVMYADHTELSYDFGTIAYRKLKDPLLNPTQGWSVNSLGRQSLDSPDLDCGYGGCVASYVRASSKNPTNVLRGLSVSTNGVLSLSTYTETANSYFQHTSGIGYYDIGFGNGWFTAYQHNSNAGDYLANGWGSLYYIDDTATPPDQGSPTYYGGLLRHPVAVASNRVLESLYLIYAF